MLRQQYQKRLDLSGGTRVLLQPEKKLTPDETDTLISNMQERLNVYGLSDIVVRQAGDLSGNNTLSWRLLERLTGCQGSPCKARKI